MLRRPFSIAYVDMENAVMGIYYKCVGEGTRLLSEVCAGDTLDVLAPLGHPFTVPDTVKNLALIGGGVGIAPLLYAAQAWHRVCGVRAYLGCARDSDFFGLSRFRALCEIHLSTQDGSLGDRGMVTERVQTDWDAGERPDLVFACGPESMLRAVQHLCKTYGVRAQLSLEQRMGCGTGACLVCSARVRTGGSDAYIRVCRDGPVLDAEEVIFE